MPTRSILKAGLTVWATMALLATEEAWADYPVSIELVLAVDTSRSVDDVEYDLQMRGIAKAFRDPEIIDLIGQHDGVAVTLFQWSSTVDKQYIIPWHLLDDPATVLSFAAKVEKARRDPVRGSTAIGNAIDFGVRLIADNAFAGRHLKIDLSGDGPNNAGPVPAVPLLQARAMGIVINGLPILVDTFSLDRYYRDNVISGPGAFLEIANDYHGFARAFLRKLRREVDARVSRNDRALRALIRRADAHWR